MKKRFSAKVLVVVFAIALLATSFMVPTVSSAAEPTNLVPADLFASPEKAAQWFERVSTDPTYYTKDGNDYVMRVNTQNSAWTYSNQEIPYDTFTIRLFVQPIAYYKEKLDSDVYGGMGLVLGYNGAAGNGFPWVDTRIDFNLDTTETVDFYIWEHNGKANPPKNYTGMTKRFGGEWYDDFGVPQWFADEGMECTPGWFEVVYEFTADETKMYVDGFEVPDISTEAENPDWADVTLGHLPTASELAWFGFFSEGSTEGFYIKNFGIYEGVGLFASGDGEEEPTEEPIEDATEEPIEDATEEPSEDPTEDPSDDVTEAPSDDATEEPGKKDKGNSNLGLIIGIVVAVVVVAAGAVVAVILIKKKK